MDETLPEIAPATPIAEAPERKTTVKWRAEIAACVKVRDVRLVNWKRNVQSRVGKAFAAESDTDRINVPADWSRTKNKQAQLFFQVPKIQLRPLHPAFIDPAPIAGAALNWKLTHEVKAYKAMDEVLADVINAAGHGVTMIGYEEVTEMVDVPSADPMAPPAPMADGVDPMAAAPTVQVPRKVYGCYRMDRVAPQHFLYPVEFTGSDFQEAPWLGWEGWLPVPEAIRRFKLAPDFKAENTCDSPEYLTDDKQDRKSDETYVHFTEIFYRASAYDVASPHPHKLRRMVLLDDKETEPVIDEDFQWQRYDEKTRRYMGLKNYPLKVVTLTYVSDMAIPPSDTEMGRPQVQELNEFRTEMMLQRRHSRPLRWFDANQVDDEVREYLKTGEYQGLIPMNGPGTTAIGEVARAQYPRENNEFMNVVKSDLDDAWSSGDNQQGHASGGETSATEANIVQTNANLRGDYERAKVLRFFQENAEAIFALMQLFSEDEEYAEIVGQDGVKKLAAWDRTKIPGDYIFEIAPDAAARVDVNQRRADLMRLYTLARNDAAVNPLPFLREMFALNGFDGADIIKQPAPQPEKPNVGFSFKGDDLAGPNAAFVIALLQKSGINITPEDIMAAKRLVVDSMGETVAPVPGPPAPATPSAPGGPPQPDHGGTPEVQEPITKRYPDGSGAL